MSDMIGGKLMLSGITLPPLLFLHYLGIDDDQSTLTLCWTRFIDINLGILGAIIVGTFVWPNHARTRYFLAVSGTLDRITEYYLRMSRDLLRPSLIYQAGGRKYFDLEADIRRRLAVSRNLVQIQRREVSLLPRPVRLYGEVIDDMERLIGTFDEIRLLRFSVPRKETILDVLSLRREVVRDPFGSTQKLTRQVSAILINLWACKQAFQSRSPLPQRLPSPRIALDELMEQTDQLARRVRRSRRASAAVIEESPATSSTSDEKRSAMSLDPKMDLAVLYGMAENEAIGEVCSILEEVCQCSVRCDTKG